MGFETVDFEGTFRRLIDLKTWDDETVVAWLEDDNHHFGLTLVHDGLVIKDLRAEMPRFPWGTCPGAVQPLRALIGRPLFGRCSEVGRYLDMRQQCTHLFDLAGLAAAHAFHHRVHHRYHAMVTRHDEREPGGPPDWLHASLLRDEREVMWWNLCGATMMRPASAAGQSTDRGFREWTEKLDESSAEHAFVLRRAVFVARARTRNYTAARSPAEMGLPPVCHTHQPEIRPRARRVGDNYYIRWDAGSAGMLARADTKP